MMRKFTILLCMFVFASALSIPVFADSETAASSSSVSESTAESGAESGATSTPENPGAYDDDVSLGNGLRDNLKSGVGSVSDSTDSALDDLANTDFGGFGNFIGRALSSIPSEIWAAFVLMILCMIVRVALSIMAG